MRVIDNRNSKDQIDKFFIQMAAHCIHEENQGMNKLSALDE